MSTRKIFFEIKNETPLINNFINNNNCFSAGIISADFFNNLFENSKNCVKRYVGDLNSSYVKKD